MLMLAALMAAATVAAPLPPSETRLVPISDLVGRSPSEAADRLGLGPQADWLPGFAARLNGADVGIAKPNTATSADCSGSLELRSPDGSTYVDGFLIKDGRVAAVLRPPDIVRGAYPRTFKEMRRQSREARKRPAGPLPLAAGVGAYMAEAEARAMPAADPIRVVCRPRPVVPAPRPAPARPDVADAIRAPVDLAFAAVTLVYWAPWIPVLKVEDAHAQSRAAANTPIAPRIQPGERLPEPETAFRSRKGVRWHTDPAAPGYAVATIEFDKRDRFLAFGIRDGR